MLCIIPSEPIDSDWSNTGLIDFERSDVTRPQGATYVPRAAEPENKNKNKSKNDSRVKRSWRNCSGHSA